MTPKDRINTSPTLTKFSSNSWQNILVSVEKTKWRNDNGKECAQVSKHIIGPPQLLPVPV